MQSVLLLIASNVFMTLAWYGHLKFKFLEGKPLLLVIAVCWGIAFFEYCLMVPANRIGYGRFTTFELKIIQEVITLVVFTVFAVTVMREKVAGAAVLAMGGRGVWGWAIVVVWKCGQCGSTGCRRQ